MDIRKLFVENLRRMMVIHGKTQADVIDDLDFKQSTFNDWVNMKTYPRADAIQKLADYFGVPISELIGENKGGNVSGVVRITVYSKITSREASMQNVIGFIEVPSKMAKQGDLIALRIRGDHMSPKIDLTRYTNPIGFTEPKVFLYGSTVFVRVKRLPNLKS